MVDKKLNPRFLMGATKGKVEKQLDEIAEKPKRVVRRDWSRPAIAIADSVEEVDLEPALANNEVAIDFEEREDFEDDFVEEGTVEEVSSVEPVLIVGTVEVDDEGLPVDGSSELLPVVVKGGSVPPVDLEALLAFDDELDSEVVVLPVEDVVRVDKLDTSVSAPVVVPDVVKPVRRVNPAFNLGGSSGKGSSGRVVHRDEEELFDDSSDTDSLVESGSEATLEESPSLNVIRPGRLPGKKPAPRFIGGGVSRPAENRNEYSEGSVAPKSAPAIKKLFPAAKPEGEHKDQRAHVLKAKSGVQAEDWSSDTNKDTNKGFGGEVILLVSNLSWVLVFI